MTTTAIIALLITPVGGLILGLAVYWITSRPEQPQRPAE